jgi:hypothetical protein
MAQFTLQWNNVNQIASSNCNNTRVSYRQKSVGGVFITAGFNPGNDMDKAVTQTDSPLLTDNVVYEFKVESLCAQNGPTPNDNGLVEAIGFACISPNIVKTDLTVQATLDVTNLDITKARFTLRRASNNVIVGSPVIVNKVGTSIQHTFSGLTQLTNYYIDIELYATVNNTEVISSHPSYLASVCSPYPVQTDATPVCDPVTSASVTSIEIP